MFLGAGIRPRRALLLVDDSVIDLETAENAGMDCALFLNGFSTREEIEELLQRARFVFTDFGGIA